MDITLQSPPAGGRVMRGQRWVHGRLATASSTKAIRLQRGCHSAWMSTETRFCKGSDAGQTILLPSEAQKTPSERRQQGMHVQFVQSQSSLDAADRR